VTCTISILASSSDSIIDSTSDVIWSGSGLHWYDNVYSTEVFSFILVRSSTATSQRATTRATFDATACSATASSAAIYSAQNAEQRRRGPGGA
jgi:hypothetical protein